jgi:hypothetical protein
VVHRVLNLVGFSCATIALSCVLVASASDFGTTGLVTTPTASQMQDGYLAMTISSNPVVNIFNITYQASPWLETTFRYSVFNPYSRQNSTDDLRDRSYEAKIRLAKESIFLPALAIGIRDILGTGVWGGEYLVSTKRIGPAEISIGLGWGRFAERDQLNNPLGLIDESFENRLDRFDTGGAQGGKIRGGSFFRGDMGIFGGIQYSLTPSWFLMLERNSDSYKREQRFGSLKDKSQMNFGLGWRPHPAISAVISYQHGDYWGVTLRSVGDFKTRSKRKFSPLASSLDDTGKKQAPIFLNLDSWYDRLLFDAERSGLRIYSASDAPGSSEVTLEIANDRYTQTGDAIHQALLLSELHLPEEYRYVSLVLNEQELPAATVRYQRQDFVRRSLDNKREGRGSEISISSPNRALRPRYQTDFNYPNLRLSADLATRIQLMDPNEPLKHQLYVKGIASLEITRKLNLWSGYTLDVTNDFNTKRPSDSVLPRVRSEINRYLTEGENGIDSFYLEYKELVAKDLIFRGYGGILEEMFGGLGSEFLWAPFMKRWALGLNVNWVKQRDFAKDFNFQDYSTLTGHLSIFYASPWHNFDFGIHVGRYLAGDRGFTFESRRTFDNGFSIGAFFTRTNVSAKDFGEGSFDKGLYLRIPFNLFTPLNTRSSYRTIVRSIERDGGRRLEGFAGELWWDRRAVRFDALLRQKSYMVP